MAGRRKENLVREIIDLIDQYPTLQGDIEAQKTIFSGLIKAGIPGLTALREVMKVMTKVQGSEEAEQPLIFGFDITRMDIKVPADIDGYKDLIRGIANLSMHMQDAWMSGDLVGVKTYVQCVQKVTRIVETKIKEQLWEGLK